ncbi:MAG TPA: thioredoxin family protein, partial [Bacteroidales bacterium]|nr:thioredoxin family protein [Bacteroidales bacterium]
TKLAVEELGVKASIEKVTDFKEIMKYGVMQTPALVVNEKVKAVAKILSIEEIKKILTT